MSLTKQQLSELLECAKEHIRLVNQSKSYYELQTIDSGYSSKAKPQVIIDLVEGYLGMQEALQKESWCLHCRDALEKYGAK